MKLMRMFRVAALAGLLPALAACGSSATPSASPADQRRDLMAKANAGDAEAQFLVGFDLCCGDGGEQGRRNVAQATVWLCRAAHQGEPRAQYNLGMIYAAGLADNDLGSRLMRKIGSGAGPAKPRLAAMWLDLAMAGGHRDAPARRLALGKNLTAQDHLAVETMRVAWRDAPCEWAAVHASNAAR